MAYHDGVSGLEGYLEQVFIPHMERVATMPEFYVIGRIEHDSATGARYVVSVVNNTRNGEWSDDIYASDASEPTLEGLIHNQDAAIHLTSVQLKEIDATVLSTIKAHGFKRDNYQISYDYKKDFQDTHQAPQDNILHFKAKQ